MRTERVGAERAQAEPAWAVWVWAWAVADRPWAEADRPWEEADRPWATLARWGPTRILEAASRSDSAQVRTAHPCARDLARTTSPCPRGKSWPTPGRSTTPRS